MKDDCQACRMIEQLRRIEPGDQPVTLTGRQLAAILGWIDSLEVRVANTRPLSTRGQPR
jgi:hypothetical protein